MSSTEEKYEGISDGSDAAVGESSFFVLTSVSASVGDGADLIVVFRLPNIFMVPQPAAGLIFNCVVPLSRGMVLASQKMYALLKIKMLNMLPMYTYDKNYYYSDQPFQEYSKVGIN